MYQSEILKNHGRWQCCVEVFFCVCFDGRAPLAFDALLFSICLTLCYGFCSGCKASLFFVFVSMLPFIFSNPSTLQPPYHCSSPANCLACKPPPFLHAPSFFATLRDSNLGLTAHPLANYLGPNPIGRCSPLAFYPFLFFHSPDSALRLLHRLRSLALPRFRFKAFLHSPQNCLGLLFFNLHPFPLRPASAPASSHTFTHTHTTFSHTTTLSHTHTTLYIHTQQLCHTQLCHTHTHTTLSHTTFSHTTLSHTTCHTQPSHTQLCHTHTLTQLSHTHTTVSHNLSHTLWQAWHLATSAVVSRGRCGAWRHPPSLRVAGVVLMTGLALVTRLDLP